VFVEIAIYASLMSLALGLFTSITFLALTHICIIIPAMYFLPRTNFKNWNKSTWFLLAMVFAFILSVFLNHDIASHGFAPIAKTKYYLIAIISIAPFSYYFNKLNPETKTKKIHYLILALLIATTIASLSGMYGVWTGFNPLKWKVVNIDRNSGLAGMVLNYAHNLALFQVISSGLIVYRKEIKEYINLKFLYSIWVINMIALLMTYTRGAILAFLVAVPFYFFRNNKKTFLATGIILVVFAAIGYRLSGQLFLRPLSDIERISQWKAAIVGFRERPIFGLGFLNFESMSIPLKIKYGIEAVHFGGHAHNNYLEALASTGIVGFIFFMLWQIFWFIEMYKREDLIAKIAIPFIVAFVVGGLTQATFTLGANLFFIMSFYTLTQLNNEVVKEKVG
jgi:O-antigen ligase